MIRRRVSRKSPGELLSPGAFGFLEVLTPIMRMRNQFPVTGVSARHRASKKRPATLSECKTPPTHFEKAAFRPVQCQTEAGFVARESINVGMSPALSPFRPHPE